MVVVILLVGSPTTRKRYTFSNCGHRIITVSPQLFKRLFNFAAVRLIIEFSSHNATANLNFGEAIKFPDIKNWNLGGYAKTATQFYQPLP
jgi:hypothetical protein